MVSGQDHLLNVNPQVSITDSTSNTQHPSQWSGSSPKCQPSGQYNQTVPLTHNTTHSGQDHPLNVNPQVSTTHQYLSQYLSKVRAS